MARHARNTAVLEDLLPVVLLGNVFTLVDQHGPGSDGVLRLPDIGSRGRLGRRLRHEGLRTLVIVQRRRIGIGIETVVRCPEAIDPRRLEAAVGHLSEGCTYGIVGLPVADIRPGGHRLHFALLDQQADGGRAAEIAAVHHHVGRTLARLGKIGEIGRRRLRSREFRTEEQLGVGLEVNHGIEAQALSSARQLVGEGFDGQAGRIAALVLAPVAAFLTAAAVIAAFSRKRGRRLMLVATARNQYTAGQKGRQQGYPKYPFAFHDSICLFDGINGINI